MNFLFQVASLTSRIESLLPHLLQETDSSQSAAGRSFAFRPRLLVRGSAHQGLTTYICPALLHRLEKLPCHKLDIPAVYSNSVRTPEEALLHVIHEAKRTIPSVLYLPHLERLWKIMSESVRETFLSLLADIPSDANLLVLASAEDADARDEVYERDRVPRFFNDTATTEIYTVENPTKAQRTEFFRPVFEEAVKLPEEQKKVEEETLEELEVLPVEEVRKLSDKEKRKLRKKEDHLLRELRIFLR